MESTDEAKYCLDQIEDKLIARVTFGQFLDGDAGDDGRFLDIISASALPLVEIAVLRG